MIARLVAQDAVPPTQILRCGPPPRRAAPVRPATAAQVRFVESLAQQHGSPIGDACDSFEQASRWLDTYKPRAAYNAALRVEV